MLAHEPSSSHRIYRDYLAAGDLDGVMSRYREDAVLIGPGRQHFVGVAAIREILEQIIPALVSVEFTLVDLVQLGDVAYERTTNRAVMRGPNGIEAQVDGASYVVLERGAGGNWLITIDDMDL